MYVKDLRSHYAKLYSYKNLFLKIGTSYVEVLVGGEGNVAYGCPSHPSNKESSETICTLNFLFFDIGISLKDLELVYLEVT